MIDVSVYLPLCCTLIDELDTILGNLLYFANSGFVVYINVILILAIYEEPLFFLNLTINVLQNFVLNFQNSELKEPNYTIHLVLNSERSDECIDFTIMCVFFGVVVVCVHTKFTITCQNNVSISHVGNSFRWQKYFTE
ncbi:Uncharacterized protein FWK35_00010371 [Aphis craccivora]|uniref:Uncharacterized protein n=1 Tax=Aphis craccivora TaxID=307492 RepID=A0A6G0YTU6_APHCR|nr:Uncharacterized protein FWK35_00010371 [Aphis craccivora]